MSADDLAWRRFLTIQALRVGGLAVLLTGILAVHGGIALPPALGYALAVVGLIVFAVLPIRLARRWRTPKS